MTAQEMIDQNLRLALGDLQLQLIIARAHVADLQQQLQEAAPKQGTPNGAARPFSARPIEDDLAADLEQQLRQ